MKRLEGKVALVTGGSRGFGRATVQRLAEEGADVVVAYNASEAGALAAAEAVQRAGRRARIVQADMAKPDEVRRMAREAWDAFGRLDILVNNAGILFIGPFADMPPDQWEQQMAVNNLGVLHLTHAVLQEMKKQGSGRIINLASQLGHVGGEGFAVYSGTKAFILAFTKSLAREVGPYGITVNAVCPGSILTDMNRSIYPPEKQAEKAAELPLRRMGDPADVAAAVAYLASDDAKFVTGQCIDVNGGSTMA